ncbi:MAG: response regulator [Rhodocyclaceae bacterium]|nr:response regulator [Rhodocyclaceae bacterium]
MIVDDNTINRQLAHAFAELIGWAAFEVDCGERALEVLAHESFNAILLDISMPGISGVEVLKAVRANPDWADYWVVAYTAHALPEETEQLVKSGFDRVLVKPITIEQLEEALAPAAAD